MKQFRTLYGTNIPDLIEYVREYISTRENVEILIGSDSQCYGNKKTIYGVVIALYTPGKGAKLLGLGESIEQPKEKVMELIKFYQPKQKLENTEE